MALSKGLRLLWKQEPGPSALLEARTRQDCLLLEAGTVAALSKCPAAGRAGRLLARCVWGRLWRGEVVCVWVRAWCLCGARGTLVVLAEGGGLPGCGGTQADAQEVWGTFLCGVERGRGERRPGPSGTLTLVHSLPSL